MVTFLADGPLDLYPISLQPKQRPGLRRARCDVVTASRCWLLRFALIRRQGKALGRRPGSRLRRRPTRCPLIQAAGMKGS